MKKRVATVWLGGCSGCHMSLLDMDERLLDLAPLLDLVKSPIVDGKEFPENVDVALIEGAVSTDQDEQLIRTIRERSKILVALGDCAVNGNVTALRNLLPRGAVLERAYAQAETNDGPGVTPGEDIPHLLPQAGPLHQWVRVDAFLPGCPPSPDAIHAALAALLSGQSPALSGAAVKNG